MAGADVEAGRRGLRDIWLQNTMVHYWCKVLRIFSNCLVSWHDVCCRLDYDMSLAVIDDFVICGKMEDVFTLFEISEN